MNKDRFKFRFYDSKIKMYYSDGHYINGNEYMDSYYEDVYDLPDYMIVEQCTGLKDKNGNLIYEGDIIRFCLNTRGYVLAYERAVVWDNESASFMIVSNLDQVKPRTKRQMPNIKTHNIEIIGNIHEQKDNK